MSWLWLWLACGAPTMSSSLQGELQTELFDPYGAALAKQDWSAAYALTGETYRADTSDVVFMTGQVRNQDSWGPLESFVVRKGEPEEHREAGKRFYRVEVERRGGLGGADALFDVSKEAAGWRIQRSWWVHPPSPATQRVL